jgi:hypothetical protein
MFQVGCNWRLVRICALALLTTSCGCRLLANRAERAPAHSPIANPLAVPMMDRWLVMDEIADELDNYFRIYREERIRLVDSVLTEGWIETHPKIGSTLLEPWRSDSTRGFERVHATLQTVRRFAKVRVVPVGYGYVIDVKVYKELEDLQQPLQSNVRGQRVRFETTLLDEELTEEYRGRVDEGWIPLGRDFSLEQQILRNIQARLTDVQPH